MPSWNRGQHSTPDNAGGSKLMQWIRDVALQYQRDECLIWPFARLRDGYAGMGREGKAIRVHRYICTYVHGEPPVPEFHAAHSCGRGHEGCVNPRHLSWKSPSENFKEGQKHPRHKLTPEKVEAIRRLEGSAPARAIAALFGVTEATIRKIHKGRLWKTGRREVGGFTSESAKRASRIARERAAFQAAE